MTDQARANPPQTDPRFAELFRRQDSQDRVLDAINGKLDKLLADDNQFRQRYEREMAESRDERKWLREGLQGVLVILHGAENKGGMVMALASLTDLVKRIMWIGAIAMGIIVAVMTGIGFPLIVGVTMIYLTGGHVP